MEGQPADDGDNIMPSIKRVIDYSGLPYDRVLNLPTDMFLLMYKNSIMLELESTKEGRDYLGKCKRLNTTEIDMAAIARWKQNGS